MSSLVKLAASIFEILCGKQTNAGEGPTPATAVSMDKEFQNQRVLYQVIKGAKYVVSK